MKAKSAPMGWNSWDCYGAAVTEEIVRRNAEFMAKHLKQYGWEYFRLLQEERALRLLQNMFILWGLNSEFILCAEFRDWQCIRIPGSKELIEEQEKLQKWTVFVSGIRICTV